MSLTFEVELNYVKLVQLHKEADVYTFSYIILVPNTHTYMLVTTTHIPIKQA